jgi:hypothetical protein
MTESPQAALLTTPFKGLFSASTAFSPQHVDPFFGTPMIITPQRGLSVPDSAYSVHFQLSPSKLRSPQHAKLRLTETGPSVSALITKTPSPPAKQHTERISKELKSLKDITQLSPRFSVPPLQPRSVPSSPTPHSDSNKLDTPLIFLPRMEAFDEIASGRTTPLSTYASLKSQTTHISKDEDQCKPRLETHHVGMQLDDLPDFEAMQIDPVQPLPTDDSGTRTLSAPGVSLLPQLDLHTSQRQDSRSGG